MKDSNRKKTSKASKKMIRKQIEKKLETALSNLRPILGEKKFKRRIKKSRKVMMEGLKNFKSNGLIKSKNEKAATSAVEVQTLQENN